MNVFVNKYGDVYQNSGCCPTRSEAQKSKFGEYRVRIDGRLSTCGKKRVFLFVNIKVKLRRQKTGQGWIKNRIIPKNFCTKPQKTRQWYIANSAPVIPCTRDSSSLGAAGVFARARRCCEAAAVASRRHRAHYRKIRGHSKPEVNNVSQRRQKRISSHMSYSEATCTENLVTSSDMWFQRWDVLADKQPNKRTCSMMFITKFRSLGKE